MVKTNNGLGMRIHPIRTELEPLKDWFLFIRQVTRASIMKPIQIDRTTFAVVFEKISDGGMLPKDDELVDVNKRTPCVYSPIVFMEVPIGRKLLVGPRKRDDCDSRIFYRQWRVQIIVVNVYPVETKFEVIDNPFFNIQLFIASNAAYNRVRMIWKSVLTSFPDSIPFSWKHFFLKKLIGPR